jgi:hypothetical protein
MPPASEGPGPADPASAAAPTSACVYRIVWVPGTDRLRGWCWCGAAHETDGPAELWDWLLRHPGGHRVGGGPTATPATTPPAATPVPTG